VAEALERLYSDENHRDKVAQACQEVACNPAYDWGRISAAWGRIFENMLKGKGNSAPKRDAVKQIL
ncbi:MAG: hypothetical protein AAF570_20930, partial [Bacteroidota bacterium]